jgi:anti-sigma regulatory factor (Ser/Thr protein kinase)
MERHIDGISLPADPMSVRRARHFVANAATRAGFESTTIDLASVAASELVTNAVVHGRGPISVRTVLDRNSLRVEVQDTASELPHRVGSDEDRDGGRGLEIVDAFSQQWGCTVVRGASGKSVWFTMGRGAVHDLR